VYKRSYKRFCDDSYVEDVKSICGSDVCNVEHPDAALEAFIKKLLLVTDRHTPIKKRTVRTAKSTMDR
jgi:hypothetical protein